MADDPVKTQLQAHARSVDMVVARFVSDLQATVARAQSALQLKLMKLLKLDPVTHQVVASAANQKVLRRIPQLWQQALDDADFDVVVHRYLSSFPAQIPAFQDVLQAVNHTAREPLPLPDFTASDMSYFNSLKLSAGSDVSALVEGAAAGLVTRTAYALGSLKFTELVKNLVEKTGATVARAETIANTSLQAMYRSVADAGYQKIEKKVNKPLLYDWLGPDDQKTSEKCEDLLVVSKRGPLTREQIDQLQPYKGNPGPVLIYGFHYNCRHSFVVSLRQTIANTDS